MKIKFTLLPQSTLVIRGGEFESLMKTKLMLLQYPTPRIVQRGWRILIPHEDKVDVISPINILFCCVRIMSLGKR